VTACPEFSRIPSSSPSLSCPSRRVTGTVTAALPSRWLSPIEPNPRGFAAPSGTRRRVTAPPPCPRIPALCPASPRTSGRKPARDSPSSRAAFPRFRSPAAPAAPPATGAAAPARRIARPVHRAPAAGAPVGAAAASDKPLHKSAASLPSDTTARTSSGTPCTASSSPRTAPWRWTTAYPHRHRPCRRPSGAGGSRPAVQAFAAAPSCSPRWITIPPPGRGGKTPKWITIPPPSGSRPSRR